MLRWQLCTNTTTFSKSDDCLSLLQYLSDIHFESVKITTYFQNKYLLLSLHVWKHTTVWTCPNQGLFYIFTDKPINSIKHTISLCFVLILLYNLIFHFHFSLRLLSFFIFDVKMHVKKTEIRLWDIRMFWWMYYFQSRGTVSGKIESIAFWRCSKIRCFYNFAVCVRLFNGCDITTLEGCTTGSQSKRNTAHAQSIFQPVGLVRFAAEADADA